MTKAAGLPRRLSSSTAMPGVGVGVGVKTLAPLSDNAKQVLEKPEHLSE